MTLHTKRFFLSVFLCLLFVSSPALAMNIWMEAENGAEYDPIVVGSDASASDDTFLVSKYESDYTTRSRDDGVIIFAIGVPEAGEYSLWGRIRVPESGAQPYDISIGSADVDTLPYSDDDMWTTWAPDIRPAGSDLTEWAWRHSGFTVSLDAGMHYLRLVQRVGGSQTHIDKILLTTDTTLVPSGLGQSEPSLDIVNPYQSEVVSLHGQLRVEGNAIKNSQGHTVQLRGLSTHGLQWFPLARSQTIAATADFFKVDVVRLAMYVEESDPTNPLISWGGYQAHPDKLLARMEQGIEDAIAAGIYVIVDWHIHDVPARHLEAALGFFSLIAENFGHHPNIIYEICNEPVASGWLTDIKPYAETVIEAIREHDQHNLIIVGTPNWSSDVHIASAHPIEADNILYAFHYYAADHALDEAKARILQAQQDGVAVFVSEWGSSNVGTTTNNFPQAQAWLDFLNEQQISWVNWSLGLKDESASVLKPIAPISGPWLDSDLTLAGTWLKPQFRQTNAAPLRIETREAEDLEQTIGDVEVTSVVGYFDRGDALVYDNVAFDELKQLRLSVAGVNQGHRVEFRRDSVNGPLLGVYDTQATGGWNSYIWRSFNLQATTGTGKLVMLAEANTGPNGGVMNLDKFELIYASNSIADLIE